MLGARDHCLSVLLRRALRLQVLLQQVQGHQPLLAPRVVIGAHDAPARAQLGQVRGQQALTHGLAALGADRVPTLQVAEVVPGRRGLS